MLPEDVQGGTMINFAKRLQQHRILESIRRFKSSHAVYNFTPDCEMITYFDNFADHWDEETCWNKSEQLKPRPKVSNCDNNNGNNNRHTINTRMVSCVSSPPCQ